MGFGKSALARALEISSVTVSSLSYKADIENVVLVVTNHKFQRRSYQIFSRMPKEMMEFDITKPPGASWGIRIGGGVDRGKVLVIEKVRRITHYRTPSVSTPAYYEANEFFRGVLTETERARFLADCGLITLVRS